MPMAKLDATFTAADGEDRQQIHCLYCNQPQQVSLRALTINCRHCHKLLKLEPLTINAYQARRTIETCATITVDKKGNIFSDTILCGALVVRGKIRSDIIS